MMGRVHKVLVIGGLVFILSAIVWKLYIAPRLTIRVPRDWSFHAQYIGSLSYADGDGNLPSRKDLNIYQRDLHVVDWQPDRAVISDLYRTFDVETGKVTWDSTLRFTVHPATGQIISYPGHPEAANAYFLFPQGADAQNYPFFIYDLCLNTMTLHRTEQIDGLPLNVYRFEGQVDFSELMQVAYSDQEIVNEGQTATACQVVSFNLFREFWVEPVTGEIVHIIEDDPGDYLVNAETGKAEKLLSIWSGKSTGRTVRHLLADAQMRSGELFLHRVLIPVLLFGAGLGCLVAAKLLLRQDRHYRKIG